MLKAVIFDFDGLIIDSEHAAYMAWEEIYQEHGVHLELSVWSKCIGGFGGEFHSCEHLVGLTGYDVDRDAVRTKRNARKKQLLHEQPLCDGVLDRLQEAKERGLTVGLASSSAYNYISEVLEQHNIISYFSAFATGDEVEHAKPHPEVYHLALTKLQTNAADTVAFEDSPNGYLAATAAGIKCLVVPNPITAQLAFHPDAKLHRSLADIRITL